MLRQRWFWFVFVWLGFAFVFALWPLTLSGAPSTPASVAPPAASVEAECPADESSAVAATEISYLGPFEVTRGEDVTLSARLVGNGGLPSDGRSLVFRIGTTFLSAVTDAFGIARFPYRVEALAGETPFSIDYVGEPELSPAHAAGLLRVRRAPTWTTLEWPRLAVATGVRETVRARLTRIDGRPVPSRVVEIRVEGKTGSAKTDDAGVASISIELAKTKMGAAALSASFAGDETFEPSRDDVNVLRYGRSPFVLWGGNIPGLGLGDRVNFWGHSWEAQVRGGDFQHGAEFKGFAASLGAFATCQPSARTTGAMRLVPGCWSSKGGQSSPPASIPEVIGVLVSDSMAKDRGAVYGNVAALGLVSVDPQPPYGPVPGKPAFGTFVGWIDPGAYIDVAPALAAKQWQAAKVLPGERFVVRLDLSNPSKAPLSSVAVDASFLGSTPETATISVGTLTPSESAALELPEVAPAVAPRAPTESSAAYLERLARLDGAPLTSLSTARFTDKLGRALHPVRVASTGQTILPRIDLAVSAPPCVTPGETITVTVRAHSLGLAPSRGASAVVAFPYGTTQAVPLGDLAPGAAVDVPVSWTVPEPAPKAFDETPEQYANRLVALDKTKLSFSASVTWTDARETAYGPVDRSARSILRLPVVVAEPDLLPLMLPSQSVDLVHHLQNLGSRRAEDVRLSVALPNGDFIEAFHQPLASGAVATATVSYQAPPFAPRDPSETENDYLKRLNAVNLSHLAFDESLAYHDGHGVGYGPVAASVKGLRVAPVLAIDVAAPPSARRGEKVQFVLTVRNRGAAKAELIAVRAEMPDGSMRDVQLSPSTLDPGGRASITIEYVFPGDAPVGKAIVRAEATWKDANGGGYGPLSGAGSIRVRPENLPPTVSAGSDLVVRLGEPAILAGVASDDGMPEGAALVSKWSKVAGPSDVTFKNADLLKTEATFAEPGTYTLRLFASDSELSAEDEVTIVVAGGGGGIKVDLGDGKPGDSTVNVVTSGGQLQIDGSMQSLDYLWVAVSTKGTITKIDTRSGRVVGEYATSPEGQPKDPSRTTVDKNGNVWATNRAGNSVVHVGLVENGQCIDRNGNGVIDTSTGLNDLRRWRNTGSADTEGGVSTAEDECILHYVRVTSSGTRHVSVTESNDVWVSGTGGRVFELLDGNTGRILRREGPVGYGGYGGLIDKNGVIWSANPLLRWDTSMPLRQDKPSGWMGYGYDSYGLCIDPSGDVWNTQLYGNQIRRYAPDGAVRATYSHGGYYAQGCVADRKGHVWVAHSLYDSSVGHLREDGSWLGNVNVSLGPTGVAVDGQGKIWTTNYYAGNVSRIDPTKGSLGSDGKTPVGAVDFTSENLGGGLYNYSDMTGSTLVGAPASGSFVRVVDGGTSSVPWTYLSWVGRGCGNGTLALSAATSEDGEHFSPNVPVVNGSPLAVPVGRYLRFTALFDRSDKGESPVLSRVVLATERDTFINPPNMPPSVHAGPDVEITLPNRLHLYGSACDDGLPAPPALKITWSVVSGPGPVRFDSTSAESTWADFDLPGTYVLRLEASDGQETTHDDLTVVVASTNLAPRIALGPRIAGHVGEAISIAATVTDDGLPAGKAVSATWSKTTGAGSVAFAEPNQASTTATFDTPGEYVLRLSASDSELDAYREVAAFIDVPIRENAAPDVDAGPSRAMTMPVRTATLSGRGTDDGLPGSLVFTWSLVSGPGRASFADAHAPATTAVLDSPSAYLLRLMASDSVLASSSTTLVTLLPAPQRNTSPTVSAGKSQTITLPNDTVALLGVATDDGYPRSTLESYWEKAAGPGAVEIQNTAPGKATAKFVTPGDYVLRFSANDGELVSSAVVSIEVLPSAVNQPPVVDAGPDQRVDWPKQTIALSGSAKDDGRPSGASLSYSWSLVEGPVPALIASPNEPMTAAHLPVPGKYVFRLLVSDSAALASDEVNVILGPPPGRPPAISVLSPMTVKIPGKAKLVGFVDFEGDPIGAPVELQWTQSSGPGAAILDTPTALSTDATFPEAGTYVLHLDAKKGDLSAGADLVVTGRLDASARAPEIISTPKSLARAAEAYTYPVLAEDDNGDPLRFELGANPQGMRINAATGLISYDPGASDLGKTRVTVRVTDPTGLFDEQSYELDVRPGVAPPRITSLPPLVGYAGQTYKYQAAAADPDDTKLYWQLTGPEGMKVSTDTGAVEWAIPAETKGSVAVRLVVSDPAGHSDAQEYTIGLATQGDARRPFVDITSPAEDALVDAQVNLVGTVADDDLAGYSVSACRLGDGDDCRVIHQGLRAVTNGPLARIDPLVLPDGRYSFIVTASDAGGHTTTAERQFLLASSGRKAPVLRLDFPEFDVRTQTVSISVHRIYDGLDRSRGPLGRGWRYDWDMGRISLSRPLDIGWYAEKHFPVIVVSPLGSHLITIELEDGRSYEFEVLMEQDGSYASIQPVKLLLQETTSTGASLELFDAAMNPYEGYCLALVGGEILMGDLESEFRPAFARIHTELGETLVYDIERGRLLSFADDTGVSLEMTKDGLRTGGALVLKLESAADGMIGKATDTTSGDVVSYRRDERGRLVSVTLADGSAQSFVYDDNDRLLSFETAGRPVEKFEYDEFGRVVRHESSDGRVLRTSYDDGLRRVTQKDVAGNEILTDYDASGNVIRLQDPLGAVTTFSYVPGSSLEASRTDPLGNTWRKEYDAYGRATAEEDPLGNRTELRYGRLPNHVAVVTDPEGRTYRENTDEAGRVTEFVLPSGAVARRFEYPNESTIVSKDAAGRAETLVYDARGRVISSTDIAGKTTTTTYDDATSVATIRAADGSLSSIAHDRAGRVSRIEMGEGAEFRYSYSAGRTAPDEVVDPAGRKTRFERDAAGDIAAIDIDGEPMTLLRKDALGNVVSVQRDGEAIRYRYDAAGRVVSETSAHGSAEYVRNLAGRVTEMVTNSGARERYKYDAASRVSAIELDSGERLSVDYDKSGMLRAVTSDTGAEVRIERDADGRHIELVYPGGITATFEPEVSDDLDNPPPLRALTDLEGVAWRYEYDALGNLARVFDATDKVTRYSRNEEGEITRIEDALGRATVFDWSSDQLDRITTPEGRITGFVYDVLGQLASRARADGSTVRYEYPVDGSVTILPGGERYEERWDRALGKRTRRGASGGEVIDWIDASGRTNRVETADGASVALSYTPEGDLERVEARAPEGSAMITRYGRDSLGRISSITLPDGGTIGYEYDVHHQVGRIVRPGGIETSYIYGEHGFPTRIEHAAGSMSVVVDIGYDAHGRVIAKAGPDGSFQYGYDELGRLSVERKLAGGAIVEEIHRVYDAASNLVELNEPSGKTTFVYDRDDRLLSSNGPSGSRTYTYSDRGALVGIDDLEGQTRYDYDDLDRLKEAVLPSGERVTYTYDTSGRLLSRTDGSKTMRCLPLPNARGAFDDCAMWYEPGGAANAVIFGPDGIEAIRGADTRYLLAGHLGSVLGVVNEMGTSLGSSSYTAFGRRSNTGEMPLYGFTGERQDPATGLVYLRARWYDPKTGRFLTPDDARANGDDPRTLHRYAYAQNAPLTKTDPSGKQTFIELNLNLSIREQLDNMKWGQMMVQCLRRKAEKAIAGYMANWALGAVAGPLVKSVESLLLGWGSGSVGEILFHKELAQVLCSRSGREGLLSAGTFEFMVRVDDCGRRAAVFGTGEHKRAGWTRCVQGIRDLIKGGIPGIDIVWNDIIPIDLKLKNDVRFDSNGVARKKQVRQYCRYAARDRMHLAMFVYRSLPAESAMPNLSIECWQCWSRGEPCDDKPKPAFGSVFVAAGTSKTKKGVTIYVPKVNSLCN